MRTKIQKWGNSLALRIPKSFAEEAGVHAGSDVSLSIRDGGLVLRAARPRRPRLESLVRRINARNVHREVESGPRVGKEAW
jgi:antitoxin MazE